MKDSLNKDSKVLEEAFFAREDERLLRDLRLKAERIQQRKALKETLRLKDDDLIDHLVDLGVTPATMLAVGLIPLALVAWADGTLDPREREAILKAAREHGIQPDCPAYTMLEVWLKEKPGPELIEAWKQYIANMWTELSEAEQAELRGRIIGEARAVAKAAGGFLGLARISAEEQAVLDDLEKHLA